jgi:hypothetical protein
MIKKSQIKEVLLKYIVPLQKQYPDFYLGGSLALILQKHIPARDVKDLDIISPVSFGDLHETKFPYRGMVTSKKTYHIREIKTCLDFFHNPKAKYIAVKFQGHNIKLSPVNEIIHAKENKIWSPVYKQKQENLKQIIKEVFTEIKAQPGKTGLKDDRITIRQEKIFYDGPPDYDANIEYGTVVFGEGTDSKKWINTMYVYTPSKRKINFQPLGEPREEKIAILKQILNDKNIPYTTSAIGSSALPSIDVNNTDKYFIFKKDTSEIKVQPVNKLVKPSQKEFITNKPYIDMDTSFIEDYILDYGEDYFGGGESFTHITDNEYINFVLNGNYDYYFNNNKKEIDYVLTLNDPLNIKDYARDKAETLSNNPEDIDFFTEEIMLAIETLQDYIPKYLAAKNILKEKFTIINSDGFNIMLTTLNMQGKLGYAMINKKEGYFNKNGEMVLYTDSQTYQKVLSESQYSQLELTPIGELLLNYLNSDVESNKPENYHLSSRDEQILMDIGMYIDGLYGDNRFSNLDLFALDIASGEYQDPQFGKSEIVKKINRAIQKGWVKIVPYEGNPFKNSNYNDDDEY